MYNQVIRNAHLVICLSSSIRPPDSTRFSRRRIIWAYLISHIRYTGTYIYIYMCNNVFTNMRRACANNTSRSASPCLLSLSLLSLFFSLSFPLSPFAFSTHLRISTPRRAARVLLGIQAERGRRRKRDGGRMLTFITLSDVMNATCTQPLGCVVRSPLPLQSLPVPARHTSCIAVMLFTACIYSRSWLVTATSV